MKNHYLEKMGIQQWFLRETQKSVSAPSFFYIQLCDAKGQLQGVLLADYDPTLLQSEQQSFLQKIADALTTHSHCECVMQLPWHEWVNQKSLFFIVLGDKLKNKLPFEHVIVSHSVGVLRQHHEYKKELWKKLQPLRELLS